MAWMLCPSCLHSQTQIFKSDIYGQCQRGQLHSYLPSFLPATVHLQMNVLFFPENWIFTPLYFYGLDSFQISEPSAWTSSGLCGLSPFILNETGKEKTARTFYVSGKIADCSFSWTAEDAMMKYSLSAKLSPPTSLLLIQFYLYYSGVVKCTSGSMVAFFVNSTSYQLCKSVMECPSTLPV